MTTEQIMCFEKEKIIYFPCEHQTICTTCFVLRYLKDLHQKNNIVYCCNHCQKTIKFIKNGQPINFHSFLNTVSCTQTYLMIKCIIESYPRINSRTIYKNIIEGYCDMSNDSDMPILFSVDQCEKLLSLATQNGLVTTDHRYYNLLVATCVEPWKVDVNLGKHGVCYHGNFGDTPSLLGKLQLLHYNIKHLLENKFF